MTRPTARVLSLLELLQSGGVRTVGELAGRLEVDERTVRRYVQHLIDLDVPVESVRGRHGGYRLARGHRLPPLMLSEEEALAVVLSLVAAPASTAGETAMAKIRRVLPKHLMKRLDAVPSSLSFTTEKRTAPDGAVLLPLAAAVRDRQPVRLTYQSRERTLHPYGVVVHRGRWYVTGADPELGEDRTLRLDRIESVRTLPGSFTPPEGLDPAEHLISRFATAPYRHEVRLRIEAMVEQVRRRLPPSVAVIHERDDGWLDVELRVESLDWVPGVLASIDRPFVVERPDELRELIAALADRLAASVRTD